MGFGADSHLHTAKILRLSMDLPKVIEIVDPHAKIQRLEKNTGSSSQGMTAKDPGNFQKQYNSRITWDFQFQPVPSRN